MVKRLKIIHLPSNVGGNPEGISRELRNLGINSLTLSFRKNYYGQKVDKVIQDENDSRFIAEIKRFFTIFYIFKTDVVFFNFGSSLFHQYSYDSYRTNSKMLKILFKFYLFYMFIMQRIELYVLKIFRKKIIIQYQGDDARQGDFSRANFPINIASKVDEYYYTDLSDKLKRSQIKLLTKASDIVYSLNPDLMHVLPEKTKFLPYASIDLRKWQPSYLVKKNKKLKIGHAPTNRDVKGTQAIIDALDNLNMQGYEFEFILIENLSNLEAKKIYKTLDVFIDQIYAGWYGAVAVELMALGKPVMVYIRESDLKFIPQKMQEDLPFLKTEPKTLLEDLKNLINMPYEQLLELGYKSRKFAEDWHDPEKIVRGIYKEILSLFN
tara:strand:- start:1567 stop:2706 length:1140 start_codon:yes stop_codon:yes gene_type:complete